MEITPSLSLQKPTGALASLTGDFDTFLTLLTTQLQNQDPLSPLDTEKFTEQLVQFAGVEQSIQTNTYLETLINLQTANDRSSALDFVGKRITLDGAVSFNSADGAEWAYELPTSAAGVELKISDAAGNIVASLPGATSPGSHTVRWNGLTDKGDPAPQGAYSLTVSATDASGAVLVAPTSAVVTATGVTFANEGALLDTPIGRIAVSDVRRATNNIQGE